MKRTKFPYKIYAITSPSGKKYVGITIRSLEMRWKDHIYSSLSDKTRLITKAIRKYGPLIFSIQLLEKVTTTKQKAEKLEIYYIKKLNTISPNGYNMTIKGYSGARNETDKKSQSIIMSKIHNTIEGKEKQRQRALLQNMPETKAKMRLKLKQIRSSITYKEMKKIEQKEVWSNRKLREKQSKIMKETYMKGRITWNKGIKTKPCSEETKRKISETLKNRNKNELRQVLPRL